MTPIFRVGLTSPLNGLGHEQRYGSEVEVPQAPFRSGLPRPFFWESPTSGNSGAKLRVPALNLAPFRAGSRAAFLTLRANSESKTRPLSSMMSPLKLGPTMASVKILFFWEATGQRHFRVRLGASSQSHTVRAGSRAHGMALCAPLGERVKVSQDSRRPGCAHCGIVLLNFFFNFFFGSY